MNRYTIRTRHNDQPVTGSDLMITGVPDAVYIGTQVHISRLGTLLRVLSEAGARDVGATLHHADWVMTRDPDEVRRLGNQHDCPVSISGTDQALAHLREYPDQDLLVGTLYWTKP